MNTSNFLLKNLAQLAKFLPYHRKLIDIYVTLSKILIRLGANPVVISQMNDGTSMKVDLSTRTERAAFFSGKYDSDLIKVIHSLITLDSVFLDIGANIGFYSISIGQFFRRNKSNGKVISFEPFEGNFNRFQENILLNNLSQICVANKYGLSDESKEENITLREDFKDGSSTGNTSIQISQSYDKNYITVPIMLKRLDNVIQDHMNEFDRIDIIKMDIEGHEDYCLKGAKNTITKYRPTILMEVAKPYYEARKVKLDDTFLPLIPEKYTGFYNRNNEWTQFESLEDCTQIDNVFWVPQEKLNRKEYSIFK